MLQRPVSNDEPLVVVGIDPGTTTLGMSIIKWDCQSPTIDVINAFTLDVTNAGPGYHNTAGLYGNRQARLQALADLTQQVFTDIRPHVVIMESPYLGKFADAFQALTECRMVLRQSLYQYDPQLALMEVDPMTVKAAVGVEIGDKQERKDKEAVRRALCRLRNIQWGVDPNSLDEHGVDATAVGLFYLFAKM